MSIASKAIDTSTPLSPSKEVVYELGSIVICPLADHTETAYARWKKGVRVIQEDPPESYLKKYNIFPGPWTSYYQWGKWYRLLDATGEEHLDYFVLSDQEVVLINA